MLDKRKEIKTIKIELTSFLWAATDINPLLYRHLGVSHQLGLVCSSTYFSCVDEEKRNVVAEKKKDWRRLQKDVSCQCILSCFILNQY